MVTDFSELKKKSISDHEAGGSGVVGTLAPGAHGVHVPGRAGEEEVSHGAAGIQAELRCAAHFEEAKAQTLVPIFFFSKIILRCLSKIYFFSKYFSEACPIYSFSKIFLQCLSRIYIFF